MFLAAVAFACTSTPVSVAVADPPYRPPVGDWLPGTTWQCTNYLSSDENLYEIPFTWTWTADRFSTDIADSTAEALNNGDVPLRMITAIAWAKYDGAAKYWSPVDDLSEMRWWGLTDDQVLAQIGHSTGYGGRGNVIQVRRYQTEPEVRAWYSFESAQVIGDCVLQP